MLKSKWIVVRMCNISTEKKYKDINKGRLLKSPSLPAAKF